MNLFRSKRNKETERYYLLPGQGGAAYRRKQKYIMKWTIIAGLAGAGILALLLYWLNKLKF